MSEPFACMRLTTGLISDATMPKSGITAIMLPLASSGSKTTLVTIFAAGSTLTP